jgi:Uma2 family endonuclease
MKSRICTQITGRLLLALRRWAERRKRRVTVGHAPLDVRFARNRILQPDLFVLFARVDPAHEGPIDRVPELCIEILSSNRLHDRVTKRLLYGATGVEEYWVVDPAGLIERWTGAGLSEGTEHRTTLRTPLLPGFRLNLRKLFARGR